jgi:AraC-like DNA-binding protein
VDYSLPALISPQVQEIFDHFSYSFRVRTVLYDLFGKVIISGLSASDSKFCSLIKSYPEGLEKCRRMDERMQAEASNSGRRICYTCHAGLREYVCPLFIDGHNYGFAMLGQIRQTNTCDPYYARNWHDRYSNNSLEEAFLDLPFYTERELSHLLGLFEPLVDYIMKNEFIRPRNNQVVESVLKLIRSAKDTSSLSLEDVAEKLYRSPSSVTHILKECTGMSFKQLHVDYRLKIAENLMSRQEDLSIKQIAELSGFSDQFHFSRLFKKYRGLCPRDFRILHKK